MWQQTLFLAYFLVAFPKGLFSALYSSSCTPHLSALLSLPFPSTTTFTQMILSSSSLSTHSTSTQAFLTFKTLFNTSLPGWLLIFLLLTPLRLNSCSSDKKSTCLNTQLFTRHLPLCSKPWLHYITIIIIIKLLNICEQLHINNHDKYQQTEEMLWSWAMLNKKAEKMQLSKQH